MADISKSVKFVLLGDDKTASKALRGVGNETKRTSGALGRIGGIAKGAGVMLAGALVAAGVAAVKFGGDSLAAYADAEKSQAKLTDAYKRFPGIADVNIESLRKYNQALQRKTGADADDIAASQASLAMFGLTGKQLKSTTPLLIDYANKTGKSLPDAAKTMGKALIGNTKALKDMGISYKPTGNKAKDYANIMGLLKDKVGGYTKSIPEAETKSKILAASFGDLQEKAGEKLQPAMIALTDAGLGMLDWLEKNPELVEGVSTAFDALGNMMRWFWNNILLPVIKFWVAGNAETARGIGVILEATGRLTGNKDLENFGKGVQNAATATKAWADSLQGIPDQVTPTVEAKGADESKKKVADLDAKIKALHDKIVTAKANGASESSPKVKKLRDQIAGLRGKKVTIEANVKKTGVTSIYLAKGAGRQDLDVRLKYRSGGRPKVGQIAQFHKDEFWVPDVAGTVISQARSRQMMGSGPAIASAGAGRGPVIVYQYFTVPPNADLAAMGRINRDSLLALKGLLGGRDLGIG